MKYRRGYTVVELMVVIAIIVALAMITIFAFGQWRARTARTEMKNELTVVASSLQNYINFNNTYPINKESLSYQSNPNVTLTYTLRGDGASYCLNAESVSVSDEPHWYFDSNNGNVTTTPCT